jgi:hypothetical protein
VAIDELLSGRVADRSSFAIRFDSYCGPVPALGNGIPAGRTVFFLSWWPKMSAYIKISPEAAVSDRGGVIKWQPYPDANLLFLSAWNGRSFESFVAAVRSAALPNTATAPLTHASQGMPLWLAMSGVVAAFGTSTVWLTRRRAAERVGARGQAAD